MAQTVPAASAVPSGRAGIAKLSEREVFELEQYEKIIKLRDVVISRKPPMTTLHQSTNASHGSIPLRVNVPDSKKAQPVVHGERGSASAVPGQVKVTAETGPNSIYAEKPDQLVSAELRAQRQRLERALQEEAEQIRAEKACHAEPCAELDSSDVLAKALVLVQANAASAVVGQSVKANAESTTDSFDESTFYSSRHDTPESHLVSLIRNSSQDPQAANVHPQHEEVSQQQNGTHQQPPLPPGPAAESARVAQHPPTTDKSNSSMPNAHLTWQMQSSEEVSKRPPPQPLSGLAAMPAQVSQPPPTIKTSHHSVANASLTSQMSIVPGLNNYVQATGTSKELTQTVSGFASRSNAPRQHDLRTSASQVPMNNIQGPRDSGLEAHPPSPLIRNHNTLQPVAPQPTHPSSISALAAASCGPVVTPAQVNALRAEASDVTSPDSSSQSGKKGKKKKKRKKRKADTQGGVSTESIPVIKQEPRSPSPLNALSYTRPSKRARHVQDQSAVQEYGPSYDTPSAHDAGVQYISRAVRDDAMPAGHAAAAGYQPPYSPAVAGESRFSSGRYYHEQMITSEGPRHHEGRVMDHPDHPLHYAARTAPAPGPVPQVMLAESQVISSRPYREFRDGLRMSAHPDGETFMAPPRPAPARIMVDAYGREHIEPAHHIPSRLSVASPSRHGEHEVVYERLPPRSVSRHAMPASYEDGGFVYPAPSQAYALPRRIVTQPGYTNYDYRDIRQAEFSSRPQPAPGEFVQVLTPHERRYGEDGYSARPASARPVDSVRYPLPPDYGQAHSARAELPVAAEYRPSIHPDGRREALQPYMRAYHPAPAHEPAMQRAYSVRPPDSSQSGQLRGVDEIAFVERPSGASRQIVYADDVRRDFYR
ncbi:hypothetical protein E4U41_002497 [Claviceps citrina]|nr:hypothetical protein E4U41_002497 [Claviceps citrina]